MLANIIGVSVNALLLLIFLVWIMRAREKRSLGKEWREQYQCRLWTCAIFLVGSAALWGSTFQLIADGWKGLVIPAGAFTLVGLFICYDDRPEPAQQSRPLTTSLSIERQREVLAYHRKQSAQDAALLSASARSLTRLRLRPTSDIGVRVGLGASV